MAEPRLQKALLGLHAALETEEVIGAMFDLMDAAVPSRYIGVWFQLVGVKYPRIVRMKPAVELTPDQWKRSFETTPAAAYCAAHPGAKLWTNHDMFADEEWRATDFYREFAQPLDFYFTANISIWKGRRLLGGTSAMRSTRQGDFTISDLRLLRRLYPYLEAAIQRLDKLHAERNARAAVEQLLRRLPLPTILLDWELRVIHCNPSGKESCAQWNGAAHPLLASKNANGVCVPDSLLTACGQLRDQWHRQMLDKYALASASAQTVLHPVSSDLRANIHLVQRSTGSITKPIFRIEFQPLPASTSSALNPDLPMASRLTRRERELVDLLCQGAANKEIADRLSLSLGTVKKELNTLYQKLEVHSRSQLMALMR